MRIRPDSPSFCALRALEKTREGVIGNLELDPQLCYAETELTLFLLSLSPPRSNSTGYFSGYTATSIMSYQGATVTASASASTITAAAAPPTIAAGSSAQAQAAAFADDPRVHFDKQSGTWKFEDDDGNEMEYDAAAQRLFIGNGFR